MNKKLRRSSIFFASGLILLNFAACGKKDDGLTQFLENAPQDELMLAGYVAPYEVTEEAFTLYKNCGLNTVAFGGNQYELELNSDNFWYWGSRRQDKGLELCKKLGLDAILRYGDWLGELIEGSWSETPFSDYTYEEYRDIIKAVHIADEPRTQEHWETYGNDSLTADFQKNFDVPYMVNLLPTYSGKENLGGTYDDYLKTYEEYILSDFSDNYMISVDFYPRDKNSGKLRNDWIMCYEKIANLAKKYNAFTHFYIDSAQAGDLYDVKSEQDLRLQMNVGLAFGGAAFSYYCYSVPPGWNYNYCLLNPDGTPSPFYFGAQKVNAEAQSFAKEYLAFDWVKSVAVYEGEEPIEYGMMRLQENLDDRKYVQDISANGDVLVGCFEKQGYEAYMLVSYVNPDEQGEVDITLTLQDKNALLVYTGNEKTNGQRIEAKDGKVKLTIPYGYAVFVIPTK